MNKSLSFLLFSCSLIFSTNLICDIAEDISYLQKSYGNAFPALENLTEDNAKDIINTPNSLGETLLETASGLGEFQSVPGGKDLNLINGDLKAVKILINLGARPNIRDSNGTTALMIAALTGRDDIVEYLLLSENVRADRDLPNSHGQKAIDYAKDKLKKYGSGPVYQRLERIIKMLHPSSAIKHPIVPTPAITKPTTKPSEPMENINNKRPELVELKNDLLRLIPNISELLQRVRGNKRNFAVVDDLFQKADDLRMRMLVKLSRHGSISDIREEENDFNKINSDYDSIVSDLQSSVPSEISGAEFFGIETNAQNVKTWLDDLLDLRNQFNNFRFDSNVPNDLKEKYAKQKTTITDYIDMVAQNFKQKEHKVHLGAAVKDLQKSLEGALDFLKQVNTKVAAQVSYRQGYHDLLHFNKNKE